MLSLRVLLALSHALVWTSYKIPKKPKHWLRHYHLESEKWKLLLAHNFQKFSLPTSDRSLCSDPVGSIFRFEWTKNNLQFQRSRARKHKNSEFFISFRFFYFLYITSNLGFNVFHRSVHCDLGKKVKRHFLSINFEIYYKIYCHVRVANESWIEINWM
jgi:hypothetical protein